MRFNFKTGFGKWIHTKRFDSSIKSQILSTSYSNRKLEIIRIGFVYTYPFFECGWHSQLFTVLWQVCSSNVVHWNLGFQGRIVVYTSIQPHSIANYIALAYLLYKNPGPFLYRIPSPWSRLMIDRQFIAATFALRAFLDTPNRFKILSQLSAPITPEESSLNIRGSYRWVRDPFLLSGLIIIWLTPFMTLNLFVIYLWPLYTYIYSLFTRKGDLYHSLVMNTWSTKNGFTG